MVYSLRVFEDRTGFDLGGDWAKFLEVFASNNSTHGLFVFLKNTRWAFLRTSLRIHVAKGT